MLRFRRNDQAFTLVELLVSVVIFGVLSAVLTGSLVQVMKSSRQAQERTLRTAEVQSAIEQVVKDLRVALPVTLAEDRAISLRVYRNGGCELRTYQVEDRLGSKVLVEEVRRYPPTTPPSTCIPAPTGVPGAPTERVLVRNLIETGTAFEYYRQDSHGAAVLMTPPGPAAAGLSQIQSIALQMSVTGPEGTDPIVIRSSAQLRNDQ